MFLGLKSSLGDKKCSQMFHTHIILLDVFDYLLTTSHARTLSMVAFLHRIPTDRWDRWHRCSVQKWFVDFDNKSCSRLCAVGLGSIEYPLLQTTLWHIEQSLC